VIHTNTGNIGFKIDTINRIRSPVKL
jgi:hypothetical protein